MHLFRPTPAAAAAALFLALTGPATAASFTWTTGAFVSGTTAPNPLTAGDVLNIQGGGAKGFTAISFSNAGTVNWEASSGSIFFNGGAVINSGLWDAQGNAALVFFGGANSFTNSGELRKSSGTGITQIGNSVGGFAFINSGVVDARTGTIAFNGSQTFNAGTVFTGAGQVAVNTASTFNGAFTSSSLTLASGVQTGNSAVLNGQAQWAAGTLAGSWAIAPGATLNVQSNAGGRNISGGSVTNNGTVAWLGSAGNGTISFNGGGSVVNNGVWDAQGDAALVSNGAAGNSVNNTGTLRKSAGTGTTQIGNSSGFAIVNSGVVDARTGTIAFNGSQTFNPGTVFTGDGQVVVNTASTFNGAFTSSSLTLASAVQTGNAAVLNGQAQWAAGTLAGSWAIAPGATLNVQSNAGGRNVSGGSVTNNGTVAWLGSAGNGTISFSGGGSVVNNGVWNARGDAALVSNDAVGNSVTNNGVFKKTGGTGTTSLTNSAGLSFTNNGTVDVQTGTIQLPNAFNNAGRLTGDGTLQSAGGISNNGTVAPGSFGTGTLALTGGGSFTQTADGVFAVDLTSLAAFDLLTVAGGAALNGTLALNCLSACSFAVGDSITILDATGTLTGSFSSITLAGFATGAFNVLYDLPSASVRLVVTQAVTAVPEPSSWALAAAGLGVLGFVARRRRAVRV